MSLPADQPARLDYVAYSPSKVNGVGNNFNWYRNARSYSIHD